MSVAAQRQKETEDWYRGYYVTKGTDRNDSLQNAAVLFQNLAFDKSIVEALRRLRLDKQTWKILDVGCGAGFSLQRLLIWGLEPERLYGIDISARLIERGLRRLPALHLEQGDASAMHYATGSFEMVMESTMFVQLTDPEMSASIAQEMIRVVKPGGYIVLTDWRYSFGRKGYDALSTGRIEKLFGVGSLTKRVCRTHGALIPPLGRFLSKYFSSAYFLVSRVFPFLVGQVTVVLQKSGA